MHANSNGIALELDWHWNRHSQRVSPCARPITRINQKIKYTNDWLLSIEEYRLYILTLIKKKKNLTNIMKLPWSYSVPYSCTYRSHFVMLLWYILSYPFHSGGPFQYKDRLSNYGDFLYKDKAVVRPSYHYNGNSYTENTPSLYWDGPLFTSVALKQWYYCLVAHETTLTDVNKWMTWIQPEIHVTKTKHNKCRCTLLGYAVNHLV